MNQNTPSQTPPAQLWIGSQDELVAQAERYLQQFFCANGGCGTCAACMQIRQQQHHGCIWIRPEKGYTVESLAVVFETLSFALQPDQRIFFILQKTDYLTTSCANSLLKSLEEPPHGYHFILLASRLDALLPTIKSRCIVKTFASQSVDAQHAQLYALLTTSTVLDPATFLKAIDTSKITEQESVELLDSLLTYWISAYSRAINQGNKDAIKIAIGRLDILKGALKEPPMPGSSKVFWKNIFIACADQERAVPRSPQAAL